MKLLREFWSREVAPAVRGGEPALWLTCAFGLALLMNKRYLSDRYILPQPELRWQAFCAWQFACLWLLLAAHRWRRTVTAVVIAVVGGALLMALVMSPRDLSLAVPLQFGLPWDDEPFLMLLLVWIVAVPAGVAAWGEDGRPVAGLNLLLLGLLAGLVMLVCPRFLEPLLHDARYDKFNWGLLTFCWLLLSPAAVGLGLAGPGEAKDGWGLGRVRFWLPWTLALLAFMLLLVTQFASRQPSFGDYYPMFRPDWYAYDPSIHGWGFLAAYEATYVLYFLGWEYFFRGFMLFRLEAAYGPRAILIQAVPFALMHINKPPLEFHSSLVAGLVLGWLAWRSRSFWPCFLLHAGVAVAMDLTVMLNRLAGVGG